MGEVDAYLAGLFDGEGWVSVSYNTKQNFYWLQVGIKMVNQEVIEYVNSIYPGKIYVESPDNPEWLDTYKWMVNGAKAKPFIEAILPYSKVKAIPLQLALQFIETISSHAPKKLSPEVNLNRAQIRDQLMSYNKVN